MGFRVLIIGGGLGGLSLGNALARHGNVSVSIFERQSMYSSAGSVVLPPSTFHQLSGLGFEDSIANISHPLVKQIICGNDRRVLRTLNFDQDGYLGLRSAGTCLM